MKWAFEEKPADRTYISGVQDGGFYVNGNWFNGSLLAMNNTFLSWNARSMDDLSSASVTLTVVPG